VTSGVRCHISRGNFNIGWLLDGIKKLLIIFLAGIMAFSYVRKGPF